jgi:signal transduction histidine kinase
MLFVMGAVLEVIGMGSIPGMIADWDNAATDQSVLYWVIAIVLWIAVYFRREHPLLPIVAGGLLALAGSSYLLLLIGLHHQVQRSSPKRAGRLIGVAVLVVVASVLRDLLTPWGDQTAYFFTDDSRSPAVTLVLGIGSLACFMLVTLLTRSRREGVVLRDRADREHARASELSEEVARQSERERIAREVHDTLASRLAAVALQGDELSLAVAQGDSDIDSIARSLRQDARRSLDDLRGLLGELREGPVADYDPSRYSMRRIGELVRSARAAGTPVDAMILVDGVERAAAVLDHTVFRIVQEALTNAMKHAAHAPVSIVVEATPAAGVHVRVANPVAAASSIAGHGSGGGIMGIRERVDHLGGTCDIGERGGEFVVQVDLPWAEVSP